MFSPSNRQLVFQQDTLATGHAISCSTNPIPVLPSDVTVNRGLFGHYLSREVNYKKGDEVKMKHWHCSGDHVDFSTESFDFRVPIESVSFKTETGKIVPIKRKFQTVDTEVEVEEGE